MLLENLGQLQKTPNNKGQQDSDICIQEMGEADNRNPDGQQVLISPVGTESADLWNIAIWGPSEKVKIIKFLSER